MNHWRAGMGGYVHSSPDWRRIGATLSSSAFPPLPGRRERRWHPENATPTSSCCSPWTRQNWSRTWCPATRVVSSPCRGSGPKERRSGNSLTARSQFAPGITPNSRAPWAMICAPLTRRTWGGPRPLQNDHATLSRIQHDDVQELTSVLVIVDARRIDGLKIGAVADYAAMLGLAKINLNADVADDDSVLRLFTIPTDAAATLSKLGAWDVAFLKALYSTEQASRMQRQSIVNSMLRDSSVASRP